MPIVSPSIALLPNLLTLTNRVLVECGINAATSVSGTSFRPAIVAVNALNDGAAEITTRNRWEWNASLYSMELIAGVDQYPLPADFDRIAFPPAVNGITLREYSLEEWYTIIPQGMATPQTGQPLYFCAHGNILRLYPVPAQSYIDQFPILGYRYYRKPGARISLDSETFNLPAEFQECLVAFGKWKLKLHLEYPDWQVEQQRYEQTLQVQLNSSISHRKPARMRQTGQPYTYYWI